MVEALSPKREQIERPCFLGVNGFGIVKEENMRD